MSVDVEMLNTIDQIQEFGKIKIPEGDRGTRLSLFGLSIYLDVSQTFPLLTLKKTSFKNIAAELLWFVSGKCDNVKPLQDMGCNIWDAWADENGDVGPIYGVQWRPQLLEVIDNIKLDPYSARHVVSAWNPIDIPKMTLPPCHVLFQFNCPDEETIDLQMYQRSADMPIGVPYNIASYSLLLYMVAHLTNRTPGYFSWVGGDCHIYSDQMLAVREMRRRTPRISPTLEIVGDHKTIDDFTLDSFVVHNYDPHPAIKIPVHV